MSVLHALNKPKRNQPLGSIFKDLVDELAKNPKAQITYFFLNRNSPVTVGSLLPVFLPHQNFS